MPMLNNGVSLEGFLAWRAAKYGEPKKQTKAEWLAGFKDCAHCKRDGHCGRQNFGYHQKRIIIQEDGKKFAVTHGVHINTRTYPKVGNYCDCCVWSAETADKLLAKV